MHFVAELVKSFEGHSMEIESLGDFRYEECSQRDSLSEWAQWCGRIRSVLATRGLGGRSRIHVGVAILT